MRKKTSSAISFEVKPLDDFYHWFKGYKETGSQNFYRYEQQLKQQLDDLELEHIDLGHVVELLDVNDAEKSKLYDLLHDYYLDRRLVKNQLLFYRELHAKGLDLANVKDHEEVLNTIDLVYAQVTDTESYYRIREPELTSARFTDIKGYSVLLNYLVRGMTLTDMNGELDNEYAEQLSESGYQSQFLSDQIPKKVKKIRGAKSFNAQLDKVLKRK